MKTIIIGNDPRELWMHASAWTRCGSATIQGICAGPAGDALSQHFGCGNIESRQDVPGWDTAEIFDILDSTPEKHELALEALAAGRSVLISPPFARSSGEAKELSAAAKKSSGILMCFENRLFFPPMRKVLELCEKRSVGRVSAVRMKSLIAGAGGWDEYLNPEFRNLFPDIDTAPRPDPGIKHRELYEKISAAVRLFGPLAEIFCLDGASGAEGTLVATWKHRAPATYGALDVIFAPEMDIRSPYYPRDDNMELTGGSGLVWLTKECSQMRAEPTVRVYRGENMFSYGNLEDDWLRGYEMAAGHFVECITQQKSPAVSVAHSVEVSHFAETALRSAEEGERLGV